MIYLRALESWRYDQLNLAHGTETKKGKTKKKQVAHKKTTSRSFQPLLYSLLFTRKLVAIIETLLHSSSVFPSQQTQRSHAMCGLLLQMSHIATSVATGHIYILRDKCHVAQKFT